MKQLKNKKVEVWMGEGSASEISKLAAALGLPVATFARRAMKYFARSGVEFAKVLKQDRYD